MEKAHIVVLALLNLSACVGGRLGARANYADPANFQIYGGPFAQVWVTDAFNANLGIGGETALMFSAESNFWTLAPSSVITFGRPDNTALFFPVIGLSLGLEVDYSSSKVRVAAEPSLCFEYGVAGACARGSTLGWYGFDVSGYAPLWKPAYDGFVDTPWR